MILATIGDGSQEINDEIIDVPFLNVVIMWRSAATCPWQGGPLSYRDCCTWRGENWNTHFPRRTADDIKGSNEEPGTRL